MRLNSKWPLLSDSKSEDFIKILDILELCEGSQPTTFSEPSRWRGGRCSVP
jgi:hypothetical protein